MRPVLKILFFPITLLLSIIVLFSRFVCDLSGRLLAVVSFVVFVISVLALLLLKDPKSALTAAIIAFVISPYGVTKLLEWLVDKLDGLNCAIKSI